jgi:methyltransferase
VSAGPASPAPVAALAAFLGYLLIERAWELAIARRNGRALRARGAVESGGAHFPWIIALHALWPLALVAEVAAGARPGGLWALWLALLLAAQALRAASIAALGGRWSTRVLVVPGEPPLARGIYRWMRHPNYLGVVIELAAGPLLFGAWRTALAASLANLALLALRIRVEERALGFRPAAARGARADPAAGARTR